MPHPKRAGVSASPIPLVTIVWIHPFLEILDEIGAPYDEILRQANLPVLAIDDGAVLVPTDRIYQFVDLAAEATGMPDLGLRAGSRIDIEPLLPDTEQSWLWPGVFRTIESFIDACLKSSSNVDMWIESRSDRDRSIEFFYRGTFGPENRAFPVVEQFMVALMVRLTRFAAGPDWCPDRVNLRAPSVPEKAIENLVGRAEVKCGQANTSLLFPGRGWVSHVEAFPESSSAIWKRHRKSLEKWSQGDDLAGSLRLILRAYLPDGSPGIGLAARLSGTTIRTLQRRLADQGTTYTHLLENLRHDMAIYLLRDPGREVSDVGRELGYRDPAIFTRAFRRWTGTTPSEFRRSFSVS